MSKPQKKSVKRHLRDIDRVGYSNEYHVRQGRDAWEEQSRRMHNLQPCGGGFRVLRKSLGSG